MRREPPEWCNAFECSKLILSGRTLPTAAIVSVVVGVVLSAVNEGAGIISGHFGTAIAIRVVTNFVVPFIVASIGYLAPFRKKKKRHL